MTVRRARDRKHLARGFTMVELSTILLILGILSTVAVVGYKRWIRSARVAEATNVIAGIAEGQEAYKAETGVYLNVSGTLDKLYPAKKPGPFKTIWGAPCTTCMQPWSRLSFTPPGAVEYGYATVASSVAIPPTPDDTGGSSTSSTGGGPIGGSSSGAIGFGKGASSGNPTSFPGGNGDDGNPIWIPDATGPFYTITAKGDTDGDGTATQVLFYSETREMIIQNEGE